MDEGRPGGRRPGDGRAPLVRRGGARCRAGLPAHAARDVRGEDRRPGRRQGRPGHGLAGRGGRRRESQAVRRLLRRRRPARGHRGGHDRARGVPAVPVRRAPGGTAGFGPGLQAARGRGRGAEHGRHGGVLARAGRRRRGGRAPHGAAGGSDAARAAAAGDRLPRRALRRADADPGRPEGARVQRAVRRSRDPGGAAALDGRRGRDPGRLRVRIVEHATNLLS